MKYINRIYIKIFRDAIYILKNSNVQFNFGSGRGTRPYPLGSQIYIFPIIYIFPQHVYLCGNLAQGKNSYVIKKNNFWDAPYFLTKGGSFKPYIYIYIYYIEIIIATHRVLEMYIKSPG